MTRTADLLHDLHAPVVDELARVERRFDDELGSDFAFVRQLCRRVERYRGKMLRPTLLLLAAKGCRKLTDAHITLAAVVEMVHLATLVHDDVLDAADLRRGQATINATDGNETAVLLGDYLISHAYHLCSSLEDQYAARTIAATTNTVCEGELMQIHHRADVGLTEARYLEIISRKTAALTGTCCALGARYAGAQPAVVEAWHRFGMDVGIAFQIVDDVLDCIGGEGEMGKTLGRDLDLGKLTLPTIHAVTSAPAPVRDQLVRVLGNGHTVARTTVRGWLEQSGSIDYAYAAASQYLASAHRHVETLSPGPAREALKLVVDFVVQRAH